MTKDEIVDTLNDLIQITEDSHEGYRKSAEDAEEQDLVLFNDLSAQRGAMVRDLQKHVAEQGERRKPAAPCWGALTASSSI